MRYLTAVGFGALTGLATAMLWVVVSFILPVAVPVLLSRIRPGESGVGAASAFITSGSILLAALIGFIGGVAWMLRR